MYVCESSLVGIKIDCKVDRISCIAVHLINTKHMLIDKLLYDIWRLGRSALAVLTQYHCESRTMISQCCVSQIKKVSYEQAYKVVNVTAYLINVKDINVMPLRTINKIK